jgi:hypothetical protein
MESHDNKRQPRCVFRGFAKLVRFINTEHGRLAVIQG